MPSKKKSLLPEIDPYIGAIISRVRKEKGLTQIQLAEKAGISQQQLSHYENGKLHISAEMISRLSSILEVSSDRILGLDVDSVNKEVSLKISRRMNRIENLPESEQRALLKTIDIYLRGSE